MPALARRPAAVRAKAGQTTSAWSSWATGCWGWWSRRCSSQLRQGRRRRAGQPPRGAGAPGGAGPRRALVDLGRHLICRAAKPKPAAATMPRPWPMPAKRSSARSISMPGSMPRGNSSTPLGGAGRRRQPTAAGCQDGAAGMGAGGRLPLPIYQVVESQRPAARPDLHRRSAGQRQAHRQGRGKSKRAAEQAAAASADGGISARDRTGNRRAAASSRSSARPMPASRPCSTA